MSQTSAEPTRLTHSGPRRSHFAVTHETAAWINDVISYRLRICRCCSSSKGVLASLYPLAGGGGSTGGAGRTAGGCAVPTRIAYSTVAF